MKKRKNNQRKKRKKRHQWLRSTVISRTTNSSNRQPNAGSGRPGLWESTCSLVDQLVVVYSVSAPLVGITTTTTLLPATTLPDSPPPPSLFTWYCSSPGETRRIRPCCFTELGFTFPRISVSIIINEKSIGKLSIIVPNHILDQSNLILYIDRRLISSAIRWIQSNDQYFDIINYL